MFLVHVVYGSSPTYLILIDLYSACFGVVSVATGKSLVEGSGKQINGNPPRAPANPTL